MHVRLCVYVVALRVKGHNAQMRGTTEKKAMQTEGEEKDRLLICEQKCVCKIYKCYTDIWTDQQPSSV